ncbi:hypothetical protein GCM10010413_17280 [Promicromonospora sukumoe]|uniref:Uncharacterized protein n=1 Tax=Promicromonospora sukumoe TaxID=88382 RepID=A0A7W3PEY1_9MICO|nr:hypothetical protein [Promicromonospora sukumoe]MBA8809052.1 hypothetical protein [Promicromonospora sukumoe]
MGDTRAGEWHLLDYDSDPVPADVAGLDPVIKHYEDIALAMSTQAKLLKKIGDGDETLLKGKAADAMRKRSRESAEALNKASGRYDDIRDALKTFRPELEYARSETGLALTAAQDADTAQRGAEGLPDPVNADRPDDAPPLTDKEKRESESRTGKINEAKGALEAAKAKARAAMVRFDAAATAAANKIRENWADDGLHHSGWEAFLHKLNKFLKKLVEILMYIGMALAILSILIPGLGMLTLLSVIATVVSVAASFILAVQGEGSWLSVIIGVLSLGLIGVAAKMAGNLKNIQASLLTKGAGSFGSQNRQLQFLMRDREWLRSMVNIGRNPDLTRRINDLTITLGPLGRNLRSWQDFAGKTSVSPGWWQVFTNPKYFATDLSRLMDRLGGGTWRWDRLIGISDIKDVQKITSALGQIGVTGFTIKPWMYIGPISYTFGWAMRPFSLVNPSNFNPSDPRWSLDGWRDADYSGLYGENPVL